MTFPFRQTLLLLGLLLVGLPPLLRAQSSATPIVPANENLPVLTNYNSFWDLPEAERRQRHRIDYEATVVFYDPSWGLLWLENSGYIFFCSPGKTTVWPIHTGQRVHITGIVSNPRDYEVEALNFTVLGTAPLPPVTLFDGHAALNELQTQRTRVRGYVERSSETDPTHLALRLIADGHVFDATVLLANEESVPQLAGLMVETTGLQIHNKDSAGQVQSLTLWINSLGEIKRVGTLDSDPRFLTPIVSTSQLLQEQPQQLMHVAGTVHDATAGARLVLWDSAGEITVDSPQDSPVKPGDPVEAVGFLAVHDTELHLQYGLWRPTGPTTPAPPSTLAKLRRARQVMELSPEDAIRPNPVRLNGFVTWSDPAAPYFYLQDSTRGICVRNSQPWETEPPRVGAMVSIEGRTGLGAFAPLVQLVRYTTATTERAMPEPREIGLDQVLGGTEEGKFVSLHGFLRTVEPVPPWLRLHLSTTAGEFTALVPASPEITGLAGSVVRLNGVCTAVANDRRQLISIELLVTSASAIKVEEPAPTDPFAVPAVSLTGLRQFGPLQTAYRRIRTSGRVSFHDPGRLLLIEDDSDGLEVLARASEPLPVGTMVEVVGFSGREGNQVVLREAVFRRLPAAVSVPPPPLTIVAALRPALHNRLVGVDGQLLGQVRLDEQHQLTLRTGDVTFTVILASTVPLPALAVGSELHCAGVYRLLSDEYGRPDNFQLLARTAADIVVVRAPSWITRGRALSLAALLAIGGAGAFAWNLLLRRRVRTQTAQIRRQLEQQTALERELQKAAKLESLGLLAGGIAHDFNNLLTVILGNLTLARLDDRVEAAVGDCLGDAERGAQRARDLTQQLLTFAKGGDPLRTAVSLSEVVRESTEFVLRGAKVACNYDFAPALWAAEVDRGQIDQVVHNLVLNAVQAMPDGGTIRLSLRNVEIPTASPHPLTPGRYLELTVADTGIGMSPEVLARIFDPYFTTKKAGNGLGLATIHSIIRRHHGHIEARSTRGRGTTFHLWLPAGTGPAVGTAPLLPHALPSVPAGRRILTMDDEEDIRRLVTTLLHRMGLEVVATADGAEAVEAYRTARASGNPFDLVIMDLTVPGGMGGKDAMDALLALDPGVNAIVSSGYSTDPVLADCRAFGFRGMVRKPYNIEELATCIAQVLAEAAAARPPPALPGVQYSTSGNAPVPDSPSSVHDPLRPDETGWTPPAGCASLPPGRAAPATARA